MRPWSLPVDDAKGYFGVNVADWRADVVFSPDGGWMVVTTSTPHLKVYRMEGCKLASTPVTPKEAL